MLVSEAIAFICERRDWLEDDLRGVLIRFLSLLCLFRFPLDSGVMDALSAGRIILDPAAVREVVDFDICTEGFVLAWLDQLKESPMDPINHRDLAGQMDPDTYGEALALAIHEPTSPPPSYYEKILDRARSFKELLWLSGHLRPKQINREIAGLLARLLARDATTSAQIKVTAVADNLHPAVRSAFRYLVVAAGTPEGREALLEIIIEAGDKASGLEVDAIIGGLGFPESVELMRPRWGKLTPHHRSVAADAISAMATTPRERGQAERLKELHGRH